MTWPYLGIMDELKAEELMSIVNDTYNLLMSSNQVVIYTHNIDWKDI